MNIYGDRQNSLGRDYSQAADRERHAKALERVDSERLTSGPIIGGKLRAGINPQDVTNPAAAAGSCGRYPGPASDRHRHTAFAAVAAAAAEHH